MTQIKVLTISAITSLMILSASIAGALAPADDFSANTTISGSDASIIDQAVPGPARRGGGGRGGALLK